MKDSVEYSVEVYRSLPLVTQKFLSDLIPLFISIAQNREHTGHNSGTIALHMAPSFIGRYASMKDSMAIAITYTKSLIDLWSEVEPHISIPSVESDFLKTSTPEVDIQTKHSATIQPKKSESLEPPISPLTSASEKVRTPSNSSASSLESSNDKTLFDKKNNFVSHKSVSAECLSSPSRIISPSPIMQPPSRLRRSASTTFQSHKPTEDETPNRRLYSSRTFSETTGRQNNPAFLRRSLSTKRGRMVSELAKLYEEKDGMPVSLPVEKAKAS